MLCERERPFFMKILKKNVRKEIFPDWRITKNMLELDFLPMIELIGLRESS